MNMANPRPRRGFSVSTKSTRCRKNAIKHFKVGLPEANQVATRPYRSNRNSIGTPRNSGFLVSLRATARNPARKRTRGWLAQSKPSRSRPRRRPSARLGPLLGGAHAATCGFKMKGLGPLHASPRKETGFVDGPNLWPRRGFFALFARSAASLSGEHTAIAHNPRQAAYSFSAARVNVFRNPQPASSASGTRRFPGRRRPRSPARLAVRQNA